MMEIGALGPCAVSANTLRGSFLIPAKSDPDSCSTPQPCCFSHQVLSVDVHSLRS